MKTKIFALFAAMMLLVGTTAIAQSDDTKNTSTTETSLKGDVNNDGVVDVADIAAVIAVMHEQSADGTKYYWYAGQVKPTSMENDPETSSEYTCNNWFEIGTILPPNIAQRVTGGENGKPWYAAVPTAAGLVPGHSGEDDTSMTKISTITVNGVQYDVWDALGVTATRFSVIFYKKQ